MLTDDIGRLFAILQAEYGYKWAHKADAIPVWQEKLQGFTRDQLFQAAGKAPEAYPDNPPTVGQFLHLLRSNRPRPNTYQLPPPSVTFSASALNKILLGIVRTLHGVDKMTMRNLVGLKAALLEEHNAPKPTQEFLDTAYEQMWALAVAHDEEAKKRETEQARETYARRVAAHPGH